MKKFLYFVLLCCSFVLSANPVIQNMKENTWYEVPNSKMRQVCPSSGMYSGDCGSNNCNDVMKKWSGGTFDTKRNRLIVWGGGHKAYGGNELYAFDLDDFKWERISNPSPCRECTPILPDGAPTSRHTYNVPVYIPTVDKFFSPPMVGIYCPPSGADPNTWMFDFHTKKWQNMNLQTHPNGRHGAAVFDPISSNKVYCGSAAYNSQGGLWQYDISQNKWTMLNAVRGSFKNYCGFAVDTKRKQLVVVGGLIDENGEIVIFDIGKDNYTPQLVKTSNAPMNSISSGPGVNYDPVADRVVVWHGGPVHVLDLDTKSWSKKASCPQSPIGNGTYGRFRYSPEENAYVLVNGADLNVMIFKLTKGPGPGSVSLNPKADDRKPVLNLSPNPVMHQTTITFEGHLRIYNARGQMVLKSIQKMGGTLCLKADHLPSGLYLVKTVKGSFGVTKKLVILP